MKLSTLFTALLSATTSAATVRANSLEDFRGAPTTAGAEAELCTLPCQNGGSCKFVSEDATRNMAGDDFFPVADNAPDYGPMYCHCPVRWNGSLCEAETKPNNETNDNNNASDVNKDDINSNNNESLCVGSNNPCENGSTCSVSTTNSIVTKLSCDCSAIPVTLGVFDGKHCQQKASEICVLSGLEQGARPESFCVHGSCKRFVLTPADGHPGCFCDEGFLGSRCEIASSSATSNTLEDSALYQANGVESAADDDDDDDDDATDPEVIDIDGPANDDLFDDDDGNMPADYPSFQDYTDTVAGDDDDGATVGADDDTTDDIPADLVDDDKGNNAVDDDNLVDDDTMDDQTQDQTQDDDWNNGPSSNSGPTFPFGQGDDSTVGDDDSVQDDDNDDDWSNPSAPTDNSAREQDDDDDDDNNWSNPSAETEADDDDDDDTGFNKFSGADDDGDDDNDGGDDDDDDDDDDAAVWPNHYTYADDDEEEDNETKSSRSGGLVFLTVVALVVPCVAILFGGNKLVEIWRARKDQIFARNTWLNRMASPNGHAFSDEHDIRVSPRDSGIDQIPTRVLSSTALSFDSEPTRGASRKPYSPQPFVPYADTDGIGGEDHSDMQQIPIGSNSIRGIEMC